jgi:nicotinamidase-related amidase
VTDRPILDPTHTVLLVMDYQNGVIDQLPDTESLLVRAAEAIGNAREHGGHVGWVRVGFTDADFDAIPESSVFAALTAPDRRSAMRADALATRVHARLAPQPGDIAVRKTRVGAFTTTDLDQQLRARAVDTLVLAGLSTSGVVLSTVREAMDRDYRIVVLRDACGDRDPDTHAFLTETLFARYAHVTDVANLDALWT